LDSPVNLVKLLLLGFVQSSVELIAWKEYCFHEVYLGIYIGADEYWVLTYKSGVKLLESCCGHISSLSAFHVGTTVQPFAVKIKCDIVVLGTPSP
jgi:hypothetical protein